MHLFTRIVDILLDFRYI
uniref:Uncharacterized protein n=1 Tax=Anguilla anguilla TaxID=7936 RepID=A0A0E9T6Q1_ANGAN